MLSYLSDFEHPCHILKKWDILLNWVAMINMQLYSLQYVTMFSSKQTTMQYSAEITHPQKDIMAVPISLAR